jgi:hypothetical protein
MILLVDLLTVLISLAITCLLYLIYYLVFIYGYIKRIKLAVNNGENENAIRMKEIALKKQPKRMRKLLLKHGL